VYIDRQATNAAQELQKLGGGTPSDSENTLHFAALSGVRPMIETYPL
jgi:hypothetical protein